MALTSQPRNPPFGPRKKIIEDMKSLLLLPQICNSNSPFQAVQSIMEIAKVPKKYRTYTVNTEIYVEGYSDGEELIHKDYYVGYVSLADLKDGSYRSCCILRYTCIEEANEQIRYLGKFSHRNLAQSLCMYPIQKKKGVCKSDDLVLVAVTKFQNTLKDIAQERDFFWKYKDNQMFGTQNNFRVFLVTLTKLAYRMSEKDLFVDQDDILGSVAFASADFENPLLIRLAPHRSKDPSKPMYKFLTSIHKLLKDILDVQKRAQTVPEQGVQTYPELSHLRSLLHRNIFLTRDSEGQLLRHPALTTPEGKKELICDIWKSWKNKRHLGMNVFRNSRYKVEFETWQTKVKKEHWDYQERVRVQTPTHDLIGLVQFTRNCFSHVRDESWYLRATEYHSDEDLVDMLLRVSPHLFVELYRYKENLSI